LRKAKTAALLLVLAGLSVRPAAGASVPSFSLAAPARPSSAFSLASGPGGQEAPAPPPTSAAVMPKRIKRAYLDMTKAAEKLVVAGENEEAAREDMSLVQEKYNLGAATILELLDAQVSLITAQNDKIQSEFDYNLAVAKLENAMGVR